MHKIFLEYIYFMPLHVSSICAHHQEVKITLHSLCYHHTYRLCCEECPAGHSSHQGIIQPFGLYV